MSLTLLMQTNLITINIMQKLKKNQALYTNLLWREMIEILFYLHI